MVSSGNQDSRLCAAGIAPKQSRGYPFWGEGMFEQVKKPKHGLDNMSIKSNFELEIHQQPHVISNFVQNRMSEVALLGEILRAAPPRFILIAARGTSDNAAIYAKYLFSAINGVPVGLAMPSLTSLYQQTPDLTGGLVIGISQSGQSPDILAVMEDARRQKVPTLAITNKPDSPMAQKADHTIFIDAGEERSVAASKTYTAQLLAIAMLSACWKDDAGLIDDLSGIREHVEAALNEHNAVEALAWRWRAKARLVVIGRGFNLCTSHEIGLKIKELVYMLTQSYSAADFRHGPIAMLEVGFPILAVAIKGPTSTDMRAIVSEIQGCKAEIALISNDEQMIKGVELSVPLPPDLPEWLSPIVGVIPGQLLALNLALVKGLDPDKPRGLSKVTKTL
jgi:glutamine---fructose-6-phosphate transaminase (isomerizing)